LAKKTQIINEIGAGELLPSKMIPDALVPNDGINPDLGEMG
jgi:hypothetical protein